MAVFERFTAKIRKIKETSRKEDCGTAIPVTARMVKVPEEEDPCLELMEVRENPSGQREPSLHTEDEVEVQERIRKSFQRMDGEESSTDFGDAGLGMATARH